MSPFVIYSYDIKRREDPKDLFFSQQSAEPIQTDKTPKQIFESIFPQKGDSMALEIAGHDNGNRVEQHYGNVVLFRIQADKTKTIAKKDFTKGIVEHKPSCLVVVDIRPDKNLILVEKKADALKPDEAIDILKMAFDKLLFKNQLQFVYQKYNIKSQSFWDTVDVIKKITNTTVRRVQFDFINSSEPSNNDPLTLATSIVPVEDADRGSIILETDANKDLAFIQRRADMEHMIHLCNRSGYNLTLFFRQFGIFRYGMDVEAQLGVEEIIISNFIEGITHFDTDDNNKATTIFTWLDKCLEIINKNGERVNGIPAPKKRKKTNRK